MASRLDPTDVKVVAILACYEALYGEVPAELYAHVLQKLREKRVFDRAEDVAATARLAAHHWAEESEKRQGIVSTQLFSAPSSQRDEHRTEGSGGAKLIPLLRKGSKKPS